ncbi:MULTISPECIES: LysR family transcriptional regulator [unclassified Ensifer]|uniref:LysR family transcriptional regulator n=1 Tax=unclassified Ensifer TaxID=2633371 RepID=UPI0008138411|nr:MULTISPECIES: LysR family transcriptional regulator [unclassified Ensifer]OCP21367.1 transcriptional regulator [Ensifer sp. LC384]OCP22401.1 transcriptional regulator [Ensifer sp. LC54]
MATRYPRIHNLNWNLLRTFLVIVEERSITKAADKLLVRQPSVTAALQKLEETLGCQLIQRDSRRFILTNHGEMLRQECMEIFRRVERIGEKLSADEDDLTGQIRIQIVTHVAMPGLDQALRQMRRRHPSVSVRIDVANSQDIVRAIAQKQTPFGFCLLPKPLAALDCRFLMREEFGIYCGATHPMHGRTDVTLDELRQEAFIAFACSQEGGALEPMIALRDGAGLGTWTVGSSPNLEEVRRLIAAGLGIGILPIDTAKCVVDPEQLWLIPTLNGSLGADVYLVTNPDMELGAAEKAFLDIFNTALFDAQQQPSDAPA